MLSQTTSDVFAAERIWMKNVLQYYFVLCIYVYRMYIATADKENFY